MADQLAAMADVSILLERENLSTLKLTIMVEAATAIVQEAAGGQRILFVADDTFDLLGTYDPWLTLPQLPVAKGDVTSVTLDGLAVTDFKQFNNRLWRRCGWQRCADPGEAAGIYSHGHADGVQELQLARSAVLSLCTTTYDNQVGLLSEKIDDYATTYAAMAAQMETTPNVAKALRRAYGRKAGAVRLG